MKKSKIIKKEAREKDKESKKEKKEKEQKEELVSLKTIARGAGIVFVGMVIGKIIGYLYVLLVARLGTEQYGLLILGFSIVSLLSIVAVLGLDLGISRYIPFYSARKDRGRIKGTLFSALFVALPISVLFTIIVFFFSNQIATIFFHNILLAPLLRVFSLMIPLAALGSIFLASFRAFKRVEFEVGFKEIGEKAIRLVLVFIFILVGLSLSWIAFSYVASALVILIFSILILNKKVFNFLDKTKPIFYTKELLNYSLPLLFSGILVFVITWTDTFMLGYFKTVSDVGIYNAAHPTALLMFILPTAFISLFLPVITELYSQNKMNEVKYLFKRVSKWIFFVNFPIFLIIAFFSKQIIGTIFGQDYVSGAIALSVLAFGYLIFSFSYTCQNILSMAKKTRIILFITILFASLNIMLNYILIPIYGINGAAIATSVSFILAATLYLFFNHKLIKTLPFRKQYLKSMVSAIVSIILVYFITQLLFKIVPFYGFVLMFLIFIISYSLLLFLFKSFEREDKEIIKIIVKKFKK